ncbi:hypothetical protein [Cupriavidus numazuensis]|uniref:Uncharacterized protein n=1 Tax=Cupriavidus numazuensis TaxID=221992 RepID=A0ABN7QBY1_9BURK|nr:hypothetical protein [Cupriavidus numazuensis]CAG2161162.1 hypothetical protein LMG26411_08042 [Cupriavidus numazuensis]
MISLELLCIALAAMGLVFLARVYAIFRIRATFMKDPELRKVLYIRLPGYDEMAYAPWHWTRWTIRAWRAYAIDAAETEKQEV